jgi:SNF2 family DNA or RNA helicase
MNEITLFPHQQEALDKSKDFRNIAFFHDMGLGKTFTGTEAMKRYKCRINLIVCQKSKVKDWVEHCKKFTDLTVYDATSTTKADKRSLVYGFWMNYRNGNNVVPCVIIINYELAWRRKELLDLEDFTLMLDESSLIQNPSAKQTKFILKLRPAHVILLSGSPVGGKYENLWTQCHLLGWSISKNTFDGTYVNWTTLDVGGVTHRIVDRSDPYKNIDRLKRKLGQNGALFLKTEDVMELPEQRFQIINVDSTTEYRKFHKHGYLLFKDNTELIGDTTLTKLLYERQLCSQYNQNKLCAVKDLIQSTQDRLVIFYNFNAELEALKAICYGLDRPVSEINGQIKDLTAYLNDSNSITLVQYQSGSMGLNLQQCNKIIYFSLPLSSEYFEQSKKRIHRIGQVNTCIYYLLITTGTVEERILHTLEQRKDYTDELFKNWNG